VFDLVMWNFFGKLMIDPLEFPEELEIPIPVEGMEFPEEFDIVPELELPIGTEFP
jgi:hypothetical protein